MNDVGRKFGTFGGVFVPNVVTILGVIMFLRTGWVVGNAGLGQALGMLAIATLITVLTSLSLSAISTNTSVGGGGAYFLVSRSLGLEVGGSIGVPFFFAQAISVAFYLVGFSESLSYLLPHVDVTLVSSVILGVFFCIAWTSTAVVVKTQIFILVVLGLSLVSFFTGTSLGGDLGVAWAPSFSPGHGFWSVFAIFFPAVTGIMSGVSMSGDLKDPAKSIPRGTLGAVVVTALIYAAQMVWLALSANRGELVENKLVMHAIASVPPLIFAGLWAATLSSALASLAAAPRTLQALSRDGVLPRVLGRASGINNEPRVALVVTVLVAELCILVEKLDVIAPIISMFFLVTYGMINLVAGLERLVSNPSFRPTFRVHWALSVVGGICCLFIMFLINAFATIVAIAIIGALYFTLSQRSLKSGWGDMRSGFWFSLARTALLHFELSRKHVRNWRPILLVLAGNPKSRLGLVQFANRLEAGRGFLFLGQVINGEWEKLIPRQQAAQDALGDFIKENEISGVAKTVLADSFEQGVLMLIQVSGLGDFQPDTILMGWSEDRYKQDSFSRTVRKVLELKRNLLLFREARPEVELEPVIDVWWYAKDNGSLMTTLAYLYSVGKVRSSSRIRVLRIIQDKGAVESTKSNLRELIQAERIKADIEVIVSSKPALEVIGEVSGKSEICFIGISVQAAVGKENPLESYAGLVSALSGTVVLTKSWQDLRL